MGTFSKHHRFREAGQSANTYNVERFGVPARSLFTSTKVLSLRKKITITDAEENVVYRAQSKFLSLRDKTDVFDHAENLVAHIERKVFTIRQRHYINMADGTSFQISKELLHLVKDITNIEGLDWQLRGNIIGLNFELYDQNDQVIAVIAQKAFSVHDKYCIDIYRPECEKTVVAILVTLQHMIKDQGSSSSSSSSSSFSSSSGG